MALMCARSTVSQLRFTAIEKIRSNLPEGFCESYKSFWYSPGLLFHPKCRHSLLCPLALCSVSAGSGGELSTVISLPLYEDAGWHILQSCLEHELIHTGQIGLSEEQVRLKEEQKCTWIHQQQVHGALTNSPAASRLPFPLAEMYIS